MWVKFNSNGVTTVLNTDHVVYAKLMHLNNEKELCVLLSTRDLYVIKDHEGAEDVFNQLCKAVGLAKERGEQA